MGGADNVHKNEKKIPGDGSYLRAFVRCPFFKRDDGKRRIVCEGIMDDSSICLTFRYDNLFKRQVETFCCKKYQNCEVYRMLMEKYKE